MKKHYILVSLPIPPKEPLERFHAWQATIQGTLSGSQWPAGQKGKLASNVWLLERDSDVSILATIVARAEEFQLPCEVRFLAEDE